MISFEQEVQKVMIEEGIASDRTNKKLINLCVEMYLHGFRDCSYHHENGIDYSMVEVSNTVSKTKETYGV